MVTLNKNFYLIIAGLIYGAFYFFIDHSIHIQFAPDWLLGFGFPHEFHQTFGAVMLIIASVFALRQFNITNQVKNPYFQIFLIATIGTFVFDLFVNHLLVYENLPAAVGYFVQIKMIPLFLFMSAGYFFYARKRVERAWTVGVPLGILAGVSFVQIYYGVYDIQLANGGVQSLGGISNSFKDGFVPHAADFFVAYFIVSFLNKKKTLLNR